MMIVMMAALALSACGRKGDLQPPPAKGEPVEKRPSFF